MLPTKQLLGNSSLVYQHIRQSCRIGAEMECGFAEALSDIESKNSIAENRNVNLDGLHLSLTKGFTCFFAPTVVTKYHAP